MQKQLVVAHYNESLSWQQDLPQDVEIINYSKGLNKIGIPLPNVGRESHTYVYHIVENYSQLAEWTFFSQGDPFAHTNCLQQLLAAASPEEVWAINTKHYGYSPVFGSGFYGLGPSIELSTQDDQSWLDSHRQTMRWLWAKLGRSQPLPLYVRYAFGAMILVRQDVIRSRSLSFWTELLTDHYQHRRLPWALEYMWPLIFLNRLPRPSPHIRFL